MNIDVAENAPSAFELMIRILSLVLFILFSAQLSAQVDKINGLSFVAPPKPFSGNPMVQVKAVNSDWISVIPFGFTREGNPAIRYNIDRQWWGEREVGVRKTIEMAHKSGLKIMLKPQVYVPGSWPGGLDFKNNSEWEKWETAYKNFVLDFTKIAAELNVEMICIGTEFRISVQKRPEFWTNLIAEIKTIYDGELTYAANWDDYTTVPFWEQLDYIGVDAYFPLLNKNTPSVDALKKAWKPIRNKLWGFSKLKDKPILFTEFGYLSVDNCAYQTWELEKVVKKTPINQQAQANSLQALFETFWDEDFWAGGFLWKWFPEGQGHEGYKPRDYTPQGKIAEKIVADFYLK